MDPTVLLDRILGPYGVVVVLCVVCVFLYRMLGAERARGDKRDDQLDALTVQVGRVVTMLETAAAVERARAEARAEGRRETRQ